MSKFPANLSKWSELMNMKKQDLDVAKYKSFNENRVIRNQNAITRKGAISDYKVSENIKISLLKIKKCWIEKLGKLIIL